MARARATSTFESTRTCSAGSRRTSIPRAKGSRERQGFYTGLRFVSQQLLGREDQFGIVHLFAPVQRLWWRIGPALVTLDADVAPDFASLHSQAYESFAERYGREGTKSSLRRHGYFHGWGSLREARRRFHSRRFSSG